MFFCPKVMGSNLVLMFTLIMAFGSMFITSMATWTWSYLAYKLPINYIDHMANAYATSSTIGLILQFQIVTSCFKS